MDIINKAIQEIQYSIPREVLRLAYMDRGDWRKAPVSLDEQIRRKTIQSRVLVDANIVGGDTIYVDLKGIQPMHIDKYNYVFEIPPDRINNRTILTALSVNYMAYNAVMNTYLPGTSVSTPNQINDVSSAAHRAMDSRGNIPIVSNAECVVVGHNTVMIRNHLITASVVQLKCIVTNDERLSNLSIRSAHAFAKLCILAVKSYIYNELVVALDQGHLKFGQEIGVIKSYIEGLSDAEENYQTYLHEEWSGVATINNRLAYEDLLRIQISPSL